MFSIGVLSAVDPQPKSRDHSFPDMDFVRHQRGNLTPETDIFSAGYNVCHHRLKRATGCLIL